ncbi:MAG: glycosyl hydrolase family 28 protein [Firmicutes bacterium]|nr:glycosyl hydrolase family 28 protein [Bacillota bacterium]
MKKEGTALKLYGDGIHDDYPAIQQMLDSGAGMVCLPIPKKFYVIGKTLRIPSNTALKVERFSLIRLADNADCLMLQNADYNNGNENICVEGGIWDMNHANQSPNPLHFLDKCGKKWADYVAERRHDPQTAKNFLDGVYFGACMRFCRLKNFTVKNLTVKNPVTFGIQAAYLEQFTFENIVFDYTEGSPKLFNLDGIHLEGFCKYGVIRNLQGACHDDLVAITSDDSLAGPIENILVDGIFAEHTCHSAVRLLTHSHKNPIRNIRITNVFGSFYTYCVGLTNYSRDPNKIGLYENIVLDNIFASVSHGTADVGAGNYNPIYIEWNLRIRNLRIAGLYRDEKNYPVPTIVVHKDTEIKSMILSDVRQTNATGKPMPMIHNEGIIEKLVLDSVDTGDDELLTGGGKVIEKICGK